MAQWVYVNSLIFQIFMCLILNNEASSYEKIYLESAKLCSLKNAVDISEVKLGRYESSSKVVLQSKYFERWSGKYAFSCSFLVSAPAGYGVYAVIQALNFRKNSAGECKDYVELEVPQNEFKTVLKRDELQKRICGKISPSDNYLNHPKEVEFSEALNHAPVAENGFVAQGGMVQVTVHVAQEKLEPNEKLDINIVFTAYKHLCSKREKYIQCRECEWIWEGFLLDKVQNCPYTTCLDEDLCKEVDAKTHNVTSSGTGTKVSIGAVATIILVLLMFACCVWMSRRLQLFCFNPNSNRQSRMEMNATQRAPRADEIVLPFGGMIPEGTAPSAPPITEQKDLPPSYSSLFPTKQVPDHM